KHFIYDIFHFDGKFYDTLKHLLFRPGVISKEYVAGKRTRYLDPIRMYLFTSFFFFFVFFLIQKPDIHIDNKYYLTNEERNKIASEIKNELELSPNDNSLKMQLALITNNALRIHLDSSLEDMPAKGNLIIKGKPFEIRSDSVNPVNDRTKTNANDNWLSKKIKIKREEFMEKYGNNLSEGLTRFAELFLHKLTYVLFLSLPFFAGILKLLYVRNKKYYYSDHAIFTLHHYIISFILLMLALIFNYFHKITGLGIFGYLVSAIFITWTIYLYLEMKRFYEQGWLKTFAKFVLLNFMALIVLSLLFAIFLLFSIFQI
ncbi:MAG: DUF3667 domain-containing protein, partial [Flavisolibacter sp.]